MRSVQDFPKAWQRVIYVLLVKPGKDARLVRERRDIALMAQGMKLLGRMLLTTAFEDMETRLAEEQLGWTKAVGACEASLMLQLGIQLARRTRRTIFLLYVDLKTFFPAVHRGNATVAKLLIP